MSDKLRLMMIELPPEVVSGYQTLLSDQAEVTVAGRAGEAVRRFDAESPDAVILGIEDKPEQTALLVEALRGRPLGALVPLVLLDRGQSPAHPLSTPSGAAEAGADRFFVHGTPAPAVLASIAEMVGIELKIPTLLPTISAPVQPLPPKHTPQPEDPPTILSGPTPVVTPHKPHNAALTSETPTTPVENMASQPIAALDPPLASSATPANPRPASSPSVFSSPTMPGVAPSGRPQTAPGSQSQAMRHFAAPAEAAVPSSSHQRIARVRRAAVRPNPLTPEAIRRKQRQARHEDYFTLLDIRKGVDSLQIEAAYRRLRARFEPSALPRPMADRHYHDLREVCDALDDAFAVLADEALRTHYLRAMLQHNTV